jgi:hypothetical protein
LAKGHKLAKRYGACRNGDSGKTDDRWLAAANAVPQAVSVVNERLLNSGAFILHANGGLLLLTVISLKSYVYEQFTVAKLPIVDNKKPRSQFQSSLS